MEAIENSMEAIRAVQRDKREFGIGAAYHGIIEINLDYDLSQIEIRDNGRGMSDSDVRNAVNYGRLKNRIANNGEIREKMWQTGDFGKYGIGLFTLFKFGPEVLIQIDTKQDCMRERTVSAVIDYKKMREKDQFEIEKISNPPLDTSIFPDLDSHGTRILIKNVSAQFWDSCTLQSTHKLKSELQQEIAEKYSLYIHGMGELKQALLKSKCAKGDLLENIQSAQHGMDSLPLIEIRIDGESMRDLASNRVVLRMAKLARCGEAEQAAGDAEGGADAVDAPLPSSRGGKDARRPARRDRDDTEGQAVDEPAEASKPCWYTSWKVETRTGSSAAMAHLVLFFNPVISGSAMDSNEGANDAHQLMIFWQELFFREESSQLPFMRNAQEKEQKDRKYGIPLDAFDRVSGFLFLDMAFAPDSNKTIISKSGDMRLELFDKESPSCGTREYQRLQDKFHQKVKAWHEEHDRMDTFEGPYKEKRRNSVDVLIWQSVTKRQSRGRKVGKALMVEEKYRAKWGDKPGEKPGDFVEVFHPDDKRHRLVGQIEYLFTRKVDGLYPSQGVVVLVRPYEGVELEYKCSSIVRKIESSEWKKLRKMMEERLPKTIQVYHQYRDDTGKVQRSLIKDGLSYQMEGEYIARDSVQISVDILDEKGQCLQSDRDKTRIIQPKYLMVKLQLLDVNGNPVRDPRSKKEWQEVLSPYNFDKAEQFNTGSGTKQFTQLSTMLAQHLPKQSRSFELEISLDYNDGTEADEDLQFRKELKDCIEHVKCRRKFEFCAGTPSKMDITTKTGDTLNIWFGLDVRDITILFKDAAGNIIPSSLISINSISYSIDEIDDRKSLRAMPLEDDQCFGIEPFQLDGWELGGKCSCRLTFEVDLKQKDKRYSFSNKMDATLMSGIPDKIEAQGGFFDKLLSREHQIVCKLKLTDRWGNPFRGKQNVVTAEVSAKEQPWLRGNGNDGALIASTNIIDSTVSVDQRNLFVCLHGSYGLKDELTFRCSVIDHLANPPYRSKPIKKSIPFEVESLDLQFNIPDSVQNKFTTYKDGSCYVIEVNHGVCDVQRKSLHGIFLQIVRKGGEGSVKIYSTLRCKVIFQRLKLLLNDPADFDVLSEDEDDLDDSHSGNGAEISLDVIGGKSSVLDKHLLTDKTFSYIAKYDGLEASLRIVVIAGKPSALKFQEIGATEIGQQTEVEFKPIDRQGLPVHDISQYDIRLETAEHGSLLFKLSEPQKKGSSNYHFQFQVLGTLPEDSPNEATFWLVVSLVEKSSVKTRAKQGELDTDISPYVVSERVQVTVHAGKAKALRVLVRNRGENLAEPYEIVSGAKLEFIVHAVDLGGNIDISCKKRVRLTLESDDPQEKYFTNEVLSDGESIIRTKPWYTRSRVGTVTIEALDKAPPRLESREYALTVRGGVWPADIRILSPLCPAAEERFSFEMDDSSEGLRELTAEVVTPDGSKYTQSRLDLVLKQANGPVLNADFKHGKYRFHGIPIPKEPGNYTFVLEISGGALPSVPQKTLLVRRALGSPKSIAVITSSEIAAHADAATEVVLEVKNGLGVPIHQDQECCQGARVRFEVVDSEHSMGLQVQCHHVEAWSYSVVFQEPSGRKVSDDVLAKLVAVLEINDREVLRAAPINVRYVPAEKLKHQSESQKRELRELQGQRTELENRYREAEAMVKRKECLRKSLEDAKAALRALCPRSALERNIEAEEQKLSSMRRAPFKPAVPNLTVRRGANGFDAFLQDRNNGRLDPQIANSVVGIVGEMGYAQDNWAADAIAAIAGDNLQAVVVRTELDLDALWGIDRYRGIKILAMESMRSSPTLNKLGLLDLSRDASRIPSSAKYVVNLVQLDEGANPDLRQRVMSSFHPTESN